MKHMYNATMDGCQSTFSTTAFKIIFLENFLLAQQGLDLPTFSFVGGCISNLAKVPPFVGF
jgi:hypothetical protein